MPTQLGVENSKASYQLRSSILVQSFLVQQLQAGLNFRPKQLVESLFVGPNLSVGEGPACEALQPFNQLRLVDDVRVEACPVLQLRLADKADDRLHEVLVHPQVVGKRKPVPVALVQRALCRAPFRQSSQRQQASRASRNSEIAAAINESFARRYADHQSV